MSAANAVVRIVIALPLGLVFGSFLTVAIHRVPAGESIVRPRSRCPSCGSELRAADNVPVVSWVRLRGRCRSCGARISPVYPLMELATGVLFVAVAFSHAEIWTAVLLAPFLGLLAAISVIDLRHRKIPNRLVLPAVGLGVGFVVVADLAGSQLDAVRAVLGLLSYGAGLLVVALIAPRGMGMGDVKLAGLIGLALGGLGLRFVVVAAGAGIALGGVGAAVALALGAGRKSALPFGPFLAAGAAIAAFWGDAIAEAYLRLLR